MDHAGILRGCSPARTTFDGGCRRTCWNIRTGSQSPPAACASVDSRCVSEGWKRGDGENAAQKISVGRSLPSRKNSDGTQQDHAALEVDDVHGDDDDPPQRKDRQTPACPSGSLPPAFWVFLPLPVQYQHTAAQPDFTQPLRKSRRESPMVGTPFKPVLKANWAMSLKHTGVGFTAVDTSESAQYRDKRKWRRCARRLANSTWPHILSLMAVQRGHVEQDRVRCPIGWWPPPRDSRSGSSARWPRWLPGIGFHSSGALDEVLGIKIDDAVAVEDDEFGGSHGGYSSFALRWIATWKCRRPGETVAAGKGRASKSKFAKLGPGLRRGDNQCSPHGLSRFRESSRQLGQIRHLIHQPMQVRQQRMPVDAQFRVFGVDHDGVEEGIDGCFQGCERFQCGPVKSRAARCAWQTVRARIAAAA